MTAFPWAVISGSGISLHIVEQLTLRLGEIHEFHQGRVDYVPDITVFAWRLEIFYGIQALFATDLHGLVYILQACCIVRGRFRLIDTLCPEFSLEFIVVFVSRTAYFLQDIIDFVRVDQLDRTAVFKRKAVIPQIDRCQIHGVEIESCHLTE